MSLCCKAIIFFCTSLLLLFLSGAGYSEEIKFECSITENNNVCIKWDISNHKNIKELKVLRSTSEESYFSNFDFPSTLIDITKEASSKYFIDRFTADNADYYYQLIVFEINAIKHSKKLKISKKNIFIPSKVIQPSIFIDKYNLVLELRDNFKVLKKYPVAIGYSTKRKLYQDFKSTPEGFYKIINIQPRTRYYKAYDINYPNEIDKLRYNFASKENLIPYENNKITPIGGEIQIHGGGVHSNWTAGCIALRNNDIDELFKLGEIRAGTPVIITGLEITRNDVESIMKKKTSEKIKQIQKKLKEKRFYNGIIDGKIKNSTRMALLKYQLSKKWPITGELDKRTIDSLE